MEETAKKIQRPKKVYRTERHIRWNWEVSPRETEGGGGKMVRYHFIIVDDKDRDMTMNSLIEKISKAGIIEVPVTLIRTREGKVSGSELRYLFQSYDSEISPFRISFSNINKPLRRDKELNERVKGNIEDYVERFYSD